jgi:Cd2+/Zn2+-exporting ATPase/Cu+-exporting ATPase
MDDSDRSCETCEHGAEHDHGRVEHMEFVRIGLVAVAAAGTWFRWWPRANALDVAAIAAVVIGGWPIYREAFEALRERRMTMELSMTLAIGAAMGIGEGFTALVIVLFVLVAEVLEGLTVARGRRAIGHLVSLLPQSVLVKRGGVEEEVEASQVVAGDLVIVKPGARIPVDGVVRAGGSSVDQSTITGESMPVEKAPGATVFAGTINGSGMLEVATTGVGRNTAFGKIVDAVERAERSRAPIQKTADRLAGYLVYFALGCAAFTFLVTRDARSTISVIIVAGACGIAAGTPLAILGAIGRAARIGSIVKGGLYLEALGTVDTVVLDKTGTVTFGEPRVVDVRPERGTDELTILAAAAVAEKRSEHPVARAILAKAAEASVAAPDPNAFQSFAGLGVAASADGAELIVGSAAFLAQRGIAPLHGRAASAVGSEVWVARGGGLLGSIQIEDVLRPEAGAAVRALRELGIRTVLLTGDAAVVGDAVAGQLGVDEVESELLPEQKLERVRALKARGRSVAMVGDGVNDAPALVEANVGIAMGTGTAVAMESADVVLIGSDLEKLVDTIRVARRCRRIILQNFGGTLAVDGLGIVLAAFGLLNPLLAAFIHVASELAFILNSTRLLPRGSPAAVTASADRAPESAARELRAA